MSISVLSLSVRDIRNMLKRKCSLSFSQNKGADEETGATDARLMWNKGNMWVPLVVKEV